MLKNNIYVKLLLLLSIPITTLIISYNGLGDGQTICLINNIFGIECIGCGMTKAIIALINGNFYQSINYNFNVIIIFPLLLTLWFKKLLLSYFELLNNY